MEGDDMFYFFNVFFMQLFCPLMRQCLTNRYEGAAKAATKDLTCYYLISGITFPEKLISSLFYFDISDLLRRHWVYKPDRTIIAGWEARGWCKILTQTSQHREQKNLQPLQLAGARGNAFFIMAGVRSGRFKKDARTSEALRVLHRPTFSISSCKLITINSTGFHIGSPL